MPIIIGTPTLRGKQVALNIARAFAATATSYTYRRGGSSYIIKGRLSVSDFADYASRFTSAETSPWAKPAYLLRIAGEFIVPGGGAPILGDSVDLPSSNRSSVNASEFTTYTVRGVFYDTFGDVVTLTRIYLARNA
ncbi:MAG: hypothetical protein H8F28_10055 [Fibrella sp.]|nr:hypothetical protein [Armatimonadota bacterium]